MAKKIAITGGIGSGKSTVASILREWGYAVFSCDEIYDEVIKTEEYVERVKAIFPTAVENERINRKILSAIVFDDEKKRKLLNEIAHPMIMERLQAYMCAKTGMQTLVFAEVPLLFENGFEQRFDSVIVVNRAREARIQAVRARSGLSEDEILKRIASQFDYDALLVDRVYKRYDIRFLSNDESLEILKERLKRILCELKKTV